MTLTKDITAKFAVAIVAVSMIFAAFAPSAKAQTTEDLQKMINDLLAQVAALQGQVGQGGTSVASGVCPYTWTRDLNVGATGGDVMKLQQFLNADLDTRVAASGVGSVGMETEFYGPATAAAVSKMQVKYRADILSPANLVNPTGYFGPSSRAKANSLCVVAPVTETETETEDEDGMEDEEDEDDNGSVTLGGEASLIKLEINAASDDEIEEGAEDAEVAEVTVEFEDGDGEISRLDVAFDNAGVDMWDVLDTVSLWVEGDKVAEMDASSEDDYQSDESTLRFSGLDIVGMEDEEVEIVIAVSLQGNIDSDDLSDTSGSFNVSVDSIRYFDADGVATTEIAGFELGDNETFEVVEAGADDELTVKTSTNDPDASTIILEDDSKSGFETVFLFDLDTDDSANDIEINEIDITVVTTLADYDDLVDDAELVIDGVTIDDFEIDATDPDAVILTFDVDGDVVIDAGDRVEAELKLRFNALALADEGATVQASVTDSDTIDAEGAEDLSTAQLSGSASGDAHTLRTAGLVVDSGSVETETDTQGTNDDTGIFTIEFEVTAYEGDFHVAEFADEAMDETTTGGVQFTVDGPGTIVASGALASSADQDDVTDAFIVREGETETFTLTVTVTSDAAGQFRVSLDELAFSVDTDGLDGEVQVLVPAADYRTGYQNVN